MDATLAGIILGAQAQSLQQIADESGRSARRLADAHGSVLLGIQGAVTQSLLLPQTVAADNTASAVPNPRIQVEPGFYATPTAKPSAT